MNKRSILLILGACGLTYLTYEASQAPSLGETIGEQLEQHMEADDEPGHCVYLGGWKPAPDPDPTDAYYVE